MQNVLCHKTNRRGLSCYGVLVLCHVSITVLLMELLIKSHQEHVCSPSTVSAIAKTSCDTIPQILLCLSFHIKMASRQLRCQHLLMMMCATAIGQGRNRSVMLPEKPSWCRNE